MFIRRLVGVEDNPGPKCPKCNRVLKTKSGLLTHMKQVHKQKTKSAHVAKKSVNLNTKGLRHNAKLGVTRYVNPMDARAIEDHIGRGGEGGAWAMMALDPFAETVMTAVRIPDNTVGMTASFLSRFESTVAPPTGATSTATWDCLVITLPFPEAPVLVYKKLSSDLRWPGAVTATANEAQVISANGIPPGWSALNHSNVVGAQPTFLANAEAFRTTHKGLSIIYDDSALEKRGRVFSMQMRTAIQTFSQESVDVTGTPPDTVWDGRMSKNLTQYRIPADQTSMYAVVPDMTRWKAEHGVYVVNRFTNVVHAYQSSSGIAKVPGNKDPRMYQVTIGLVYEDGTEQLTVLETPISTTAARQYMRVSGQDNTQIAVVLFKGLGGTGVLDLKFVQGSEVQVDSATPWALFNEKAPDPDQAALDDQIVIQDRLPYAYPEKYNAWGALIPVIGAVLNSILPWAAGKVGGWISSKLQPKKAEYVDLPLD